MTIVQYIKSLFAENRERSIYFSITLLFVFLLPLYKIAASPFLILLAAISIIKIVSSKGKTLSQLFSSKINILFIAFFAFYTFSLLYSENIEKGFILVKNFLPFILVPFFFHFYKPSKQDIHYFLKAFVLGCFMAFVLSLGSQFYNYILGNEYSFYYLDFVDILWMHPTYLSLYLNFSIFIVYYFYLKGDIHSVVAFTAIIIFVAFILLLLARMQIIVMLMSLLILLIHLLRNKFDFKKAAIIIAIIVGVFFIISKNEALTKRFTYIKTLDYDYTQEKNWNGANVRLAMWNSAGDVISKHKWLGVGVGDAHDELLNSYKNNGFLFAYDLNYVAHNQYVQILLETGIVGLLLYFSLFIYLFYQSYKYKNFLLFALGFILLFTGVTESFLLMQSGVVFFVLLIFLTLHLDFKKAV